MRPYHVNWESDLMPAQLACIETYAIAQLNRRGILPVFCGSFRMIRRRGCQRCEEMLRFDEQGSSYRIHSKGIAVWKLEKNLEEVIFWFTVGEMTFEVNDKREVCIVAGPALCCRCLALARPFCRWRERLLF